MINWIKTHWRYIFYPIGILLFAILIFRQRNKIASDPTGEIFKKDADNIKNDVEKINKQAENIEKKRIRDSRKTGDEGLEIIKEAMKKLDKADK